jgi:regulator of RNase E activity RraA
MQPDPALLARLQRLDSCALSDAPDKLRLPGCVSGLAPLSSTRRIPGRVRTVRLVRKEAAPASQPPRHLGATTIANAARGEIIVVEQRTGIEAGSWGGILSLGASLAGVAGVVAEGLVRDVDEARALDFPIFARGTTAHTARNRIAEEASDVPVTIGDVAVNPGDWVLADATAVVFVRAADIAAVLGAAEEIARRELAICDALRAGTPIETAMGANYEHMLER